MRQVLETADDPSEQLASTKQQLEEEFANGPSELGFWLAGARFLSVVLVVLALALAVLAPLVVLTATRTAAGLLENVHMPDLQRLLTTTDPAARLSFLLEHSLPSESAASSDGGGAP